MAWTTYVATVTATTTNSYLYDNVNSLDLPDSPSARAKCAHCGQWGEEKSECLKCGAPIDPPKDRQLRIDMPYSTSSNNVFVEVTSRGSQHREYLLPNGNVLRISEADLARWLTH